MYAIRQMYNQGGESTTYQAVRTTRHALQRDHRSPLGKGSVGGHPYGTDLPADDRASLVASLRALSAVGYNDRCRSNRHGTWLVRPTPRPSARPRRGSCAGSLEPAYFEVHKVRRGDLLAKEPRSLKNGGFAHGFDAGRLCMTREQTQFKGREYETFYAPREGGVACRHFGYSPDKKAINSVFFEVDEGRVVRIDTIYSAQRTTMAQTFTYDPAGRLTTIERQGSEKQHDCRDLEWDAEGIVRVYWRYLDGRRTLTFERTGEGATLAKQKTKLRAVLVDAVVQAQQEAPGRHDEGLRDLRRRGRLCGARPRADGAADHPRAPRRLQEARDALALQGDPRGRGPKPRFGRVARGALPTRRRRVLAMARSRIVPVARLARAANRPQSLRASVQGLRDRAVPSRAAIAGVLRAAPLARHDRCIGPGRTHVRIGRDGSRHR